jgi:hypothetical protein
MSAGVLIVSCVIVPVTLVVGMIVLAVGVPVVGIGQLIMRIAERDPFKGFRGILGTFRFTERNVMRWWIVEHQVGRARRRRKSLGGAEPHNVRPV